MSHFDVFQADEQAVWDTFSTIRNRYPDAELKVTIEDGIVVISGQAATENERTEIIDAFRAVSPGLTPVVAGGLDVNRATRPPGHGRRRATALHFSSRMEELSRRTTQRIYRVQQDDTLAAIAMRFYSDPKAVRLLCFANGDQLTSSRRVQPGTMLTVPETLYHSIGPGETLKTVAVRYYRDAKMTSALEKANPEIGGKDEGLEPGSMIRVPLNP